MNTKYSLFLKWSAAAIIMVTLLSGNLVYPASSVYAAPGDFTRVSVDSTGAQANNYSKDAAISGDGRYVAFISAATNLVSGDTNNHEDIFVHDRSTGQTTRVSISSSGAEANDYPETPDISSDGRYVAFSSYATNLVSDDTNGKVDIFVHDRTTGQTTRVSVDSSGAQANDESYDVSISGDGRYVAFSSIATNLVSGDANNAQDVFIHDRDTNQTSRISLDSSGLEANDHSSSASISSDGRYVTFSSSATNLVSGDTNGRGDVFVRDRQTGATTRVSINSSGEQADGGGSYPDLSDDGRYVVFLSQSINLAPGTEDYDELIYVHDRQTAQTTLVSVYDGGGIMITGWLGEPAISSDGRFVTFRFYDKSDNNGISHIWIRDLQASDSTRIKYGNDSSHDPSVSADGSFIAFSSDASNMISGDTNEVEDVFVYEASISAPVTPYVESIQQDCPRGCISPADQIVDFTVTFSEPVTGVTADDFALTVTGGISGAFVAEVVPTDWNYIVAVNVGSGDGTLRLDLIDNDSILDAQGDYLGGAGAGNGDFTAGDVYTVNKTVGAPTVTGILRADPDPTSSASVNFSVTFSNDVSGVDSSDFTLTTTGGISGATVQNVTGSENAYTVTVGTGSGDGTLRLDVLDDDSIQDPSGYRLGGEGAGNGNFTTGEVYTVEKMVPLVASSLRADPDPTTAAVVNFNVSFTEAVSGVDPSDFTLVTTGELTNASITGVGGSGNLYTVTVATGVGDGTLRLDLLDNDSIVDATGQPLGGVGAGNGNFTTGEAYTFTRTPVNKITESFRSNGAHDGWVLESSEDSNQGGSKNSNASTFMLGDDAQDRQFRAILHFPTNHLPDNAVITRVLLMIRKESLVGEDPFTTHQNILVDIRSGAFGYFGPFPFRGLQDSDFESPSDMDAAGVIANNDLDHWYWAWLDASAFTHVNLNGITQLRLRFQVDDNDDLGDDYLRFYSGDNDELSFRPRLLVEYYTLR